MDNFKLGILLVDGFAMMSYASVVEPLRASNLLLKNSFYQIINIPISQAHAVSSNGAIIKADTHLGETADFDLVLVVAGGDPFAINNQRLFQWLRHLGSRGIRLGGVSGGPVILVKAGVMKGRRMTVHWEHARILAEMFPFIMLEKTLYVIDRDRTTCAGGIAPLDMMHALISDHHNANFAQKVSDWFMHTQIRPASGPQRAGLIEQYQTTNARVISAIEMMTDHIADTLSLSQLARKSNISGRQLNRLFKENLQQSTIDFYRDLRLEKARDLLQKSTISITEIALATGFSSSAHFSHSFARKFGTPPSKLRA